jgi:hypothetical protein
MYSMAKTSLTSWKKRQRYLNISISALALCVLFAAGCSPDKQVNTEAVRREIAVREPMRITESQILQKAGEQGSKTATVAQAALSQALQKAMAEGGVEKAIAYCNINALPLLDSVQRPVPSIIRRVSLRLRNESNAPNELELELLHAYHQARQDSIDLPENVQMLGDSVLFTKPIAISNGLCLTCHGQPGESLTAETYNMLRRYYPKDAATRYQMGELRGMWSIRMAKKDIILAIQTDNLE